MKNPIYTEKTQCRDCYKCVRSCPVKAITVQDHHATIESERCIVCGKCVKNCPAEAQLVRNGTSRLKQLLKLNKKVYLSLAPSFPAEFDCEWEMFFGKIMALGFTGISETAHGADLISAELQKVMNDNPGLVLSTACPTFVELVVRYYPELIPNLSSLPSPMEAHAIQLRKLYGDDIAVVFAGPCLSKKLEADRIPDLVNLSLTFKELSELLEDVDCAQENLHVVPSRPNKGVIYPLDGGMVETMLKSDSSILETGYANISGLEAILETLDQLVKSKHDNGYFCEMLACEGGCVNGPGCASESSALVKRTRMAKFCREYVDKIPSSGECFPVLNAADIVSDRKRVEPVQVTRYTELEIQDAFNELEKDEDHIFDCSGCGYNTCDEFAQAWLSGFAQREMCVTNMRRHAQSKVNALIKTIPMGVVIVNNQYLTMDCNDLFISMFVGEEFVADFTENDEPFRNMDINKFVPVEQLIREAQQTRCAVDKILKHEGRVLKIVTFPIENNGMTGLLFQDITEPAMKRSTVIIKAEEVIHKNLQSVQQIASLLGENAAETEIILNSLIGAFDTGGRK